MTNLNGRIAVEDGVDCQYPLYGRMDTVTPYSVVGKSIGRSGAFHLPRTGGVATANAKFFTGQQEREDYEN